MKKRMTHQLALLAALQLLFACSTSRYYDFAAGNGSQRPAYHNAALPAPAAVASRQTPVRPDQEVAQVSEEMAVLEASAAAPAPVALLKQPRAIQAERLRQASATETAAPVAKAAAPVLHQKALRQLVKKELRQRQPDQQNPAVVGTLLLVILAIILPPLAVFLKRGISGAFWLNILLTLLFWIPGVVHALIVVLMP